jgi:hypothetical protein
VVVRFMAELFLRVDGLWWRSEPATGSHSEIRDDKPSRAESPRGVTRSESSSDDRRVSRLEEERERAAASHSPTHTRRPRIAGYAFATVTDLSTSTSLTYGGQRRRSADVLP